MVRETAGWTRPGLTLATSTSASTLVHYYQVGSGGGKLPSSKLSSGAKGKGLDVTLDDLAGFN